jgi:hypothetical protein
MRLGKNSQVDAEIYSNEATVWLQAMDAGFIYKEAPWWMARLGNR